MCKVYLRDDPPDHGDDIDDDVGSQEEVDNHHPHSASVIKLGAHLI